MHKKSDKEIGQLWCPLATKPFNLSTPVGILLESSFYWLSIDI